MQKTKKVTFILPAEIVADAAQGLLLGEFNNWDKEHGFSLKKGRDGSMKATVELEAGKSYEYRYLLDGGRWVNDEMAGDYVPVHGLGVLNCRIEVAAEETQKPVRSSASKAISKTPQKKANKGLSQNAAADDLTRIEGIGKKIAALLSKEQIGSFATLSKTTPKRLKAILEAAGKTFSMHDPASWPKQAKLAAAGKWEELEALQDTLKGGK